MADAKLTGNVEETFVKADGNYWSGQLIEIPLQSGYEVLNSEVV